MGAGNDGRGGGVRNVDRMPRWSEMDKRPMEKVRSNATAIDGRPVVCLSSCHVW